MRWSVLFYVIAVFLGVRWCADAQRFLNNRPYPTYSLEHMPDTSFTCRSKILGGYYADQETQCQMFHVCVKVPGLGVQDFRFLCPNGTAFDQDAQICADWDDVDCEAATLYYSSDNFDLYRLGSGFETAPFPGEDEGTFHLQRSETGDARLSRERESIRVNQQVDYNTARPTKRPEFHKERDIFRGSSSSNFFNNKNGGKENDEDYEDHPIPNRNTNNDIPKKKIIRKFNRKQEETIQPRQQPTPTTTTTTTTIQPPTQRNTRPSGFVNNFAGSPFVPSTTGRTISTTSAITPEQYTTAIQNYRGRQRGRNYNNNNNGENFQQRPTTPSYTQVESLRTNVQPRRNEQYRTPTTPERSQSTSTPYRNTDNRQYKNVQRTETTGTPKFENTRTNPQYNPQTQTQTQTQRPYSSFKTENYPTTSAPITSYKPANSNRNNGNNQPYDRIKNAENYPSTSSNYQNPKKPTTFKSENYPTTYSPKGKNSQYFTNQKSESASTPFDNYSKSKTNQYIQKQESSSINPIDYNKPKGFDFTYQQQQQSYSTTPRSTTQHTQYTPTVPKQSTPYHPTTQLPKLAKTFDYDDGSYNPKYNDEHYNPKYEDEKYKEDEIFKTAHSQNFASSRNELSQSSKINLPIPTKESPRPFSATTIQPPKVNNNNKTNKNNNDPKIIIGIKNAEKKEKDTSYDYAYYDTNVGSEPEYDIVTEFSKSNVKN